MEKVIEIFESIKNTSSLNEKKSIITANKDNELFKKCLRFLLDTNIQTGISSKKINKEIKNSEVMLLSTFQDIQKTSYFDGVIEYLKEHDTGTDLDIYVMRTFLVNQKEEHKDFYKEMICKSYKLGCNKKVINDCIPGLIPTFDLQLGTPLDKVDLKNGTRFFITRKLNRNPLCLV